MYNNPYVPNYQNAFSQQSMNERIDSQIAQLQQMKEQIKNQQHQPAINQTFQLAPTGSNTIKYANTIEDVNKEVVYGETPYFSKDMSVVWIKNEKGEIKTYELVQIITKDNRDIQIEYLQAQIEELKGKIVNESENDVNESTSKTDKSEKSATVSTVSRTLKKSKQSE